MEELLQRRRVAVTFAATVLSVGLALALWIIGVPSQWHPVIVGLCGVGIGVVAGRDKWFIGTGAFVVVFAVAMRLLDDMVVSFVLAWAVHFVVFWVLSTKQQVSLIRRVAGGLLAPLAVAFGTIPLGLFVNSIALPSVNVDQTIADISGTLVTENVVQPTMIGAVSYFGSQEGHIFTDSSNSLRSLKHYFQLVDDCRFRGQEACDQALMTYETSYPEVQAPFDGTIRSIMAGTTEGRAEDYTIVLTPTDHPNVEVTLFHLKVLDSELLNFADSGLGVGPTSDFMVLFGSPRIGKTMNVTAGQRLGWGLDDISVNVSAIGEPYFLIGTDGCDRGALALLLKFNPACTRETKLVSYFSLLTPDVMSEWKTWGLSSADDVVLSAEEMGRDYFMTVGDTSYFVNAGEDAIRKSVADLTSKQVTSTNEVFEIADGDIVLVALLDAGEIRIVGDDGSGIEGCSCMARLDRRPGEQENGDVSPVTVLTDLPVGKSLKISGGVPFVAGVVASQDAQQVQRLIGGFVRPVRGGQ
jgi:hypothetical protein